jgi:hypothetical protein
MGAVSSLSCCSRVLCDCVCITSMWALRLMYLMPPMYCSQWRGVRLYMLWELVLVSC